MIAIPRALARELSRVFRRLGPASLEWTAGRDGLTIQAVGSDAAVRHHLPGARPAARLVTSVAALAGPIATIRPEAGAARAAPPFPTPPKRFTPVPGRLFAALAAAGSVAARDVTTRFVLNRIQLRGGRRGAVVASDSKQLLVQTGFAFPWSDDVLVSNAEVFAMLATPAPETATIARTGTHVWVRAGPWSVALPIHAGRYPEVDPLLVRADRPGGELILGESDRERLLRELPRLPGAREPGKPVVIDLAGPVIRADGEAGEPVATVPLPQSRVQGKRIRITCDRTYLLAALKLGFTRMSASTPDQPLVWRDDTRTHLFLPLGSEHDEPSPRTRTSAGTRAPEPAPVPRTRKPRTAQPANRPPRPERNRPMPEPRSRPPRDARERGGWGGWWSRVRGLFRGSGRSE